MKAKPTSRALENDGIARRADDEIRVSLASEGEVGINESTKAQPATGVTTANPKRLAWR